MAYRNQKNIPNLQVLQPGERTPHGKSGGTRNEYICLKAHQVLMAVIIHKTKHGSLYAMLLNDISP